MNRIVFTALIGGWIASLVFGMAWYLLRPIFTTVKVEVVLDRETNCQVGEIFADPWSGPINNPAYYYRLPYRLAGDKLIGAANVQAPSSFFRLDYCDRTGESLLLKRIEVTSETGKVTILPADMLNWECQNCSLSLESTAGTPVLKLVSESGDPLLIQRHFTTILDQLDLRYQRQHPRLRALFGKGALAALFLMVAACAWLTTSRRDFWFQAAALTGMVISGLVAYLLAPMLVRKFPPPPLSLGIGYVQFNGISPQAEFVLYLLPIAVAFGLVGMLTLIRKRAGYDR